MLLLSFIFCLSYSHFFILLSEVFLNKLLETVKNTVFLRGGEALAHSLPIVLAIYD